MHNPTQLHCGQDTKSLVVESDILSTNAESLRSRMLGVLQSTEAGGEAPGVFELDMRAARMIDSVGLNLLVWLLKKVQGAGGRLRLLIADTNIERTLQFTRLTQHVEVVRQERGHARLEN